MPRRDDVDIPEPTEGERAAFDAWLKRNDIREPFHPDQHYDYVGAFRAGIDRDKGSAHFPDTFKLPGHETFSDESQYARGAMKRYAGHWNGDKYTPGAERYRRMADEFEKVQDEFEPVADDFEPADAPQTDAQRQRSLLDRFKAAAYGAGQGALLNFADEAAGLGGAIGETLAAKLGRDVEDRSFGDRYREARNFAHNEYDAARKADPWAYGLGGVAGSLGSVGAAGKLGINLAARGGKAIAQGAGIGALSGLGGSTADLTKGEVGDAAVDTGIGAGVGAVASAVAPYVVDKAAKYLANPIAKVKEVAGEAMQLPQKAYEAVAERVGRTAMAQKSSSAAADVSGNAASAQVRALRQIRDNAEMGSELARSLRTASESLGGTGNKLVSAMTQEERGQVAKAMAELLHTRGLADVTPEFVAQNMDDLARSAGLELENLTGNTFLRMANKRDPQWWVSAGEGVRKFWGSKLLAGETIDPRLAQQYGLNREVADSMAKGEVDRMGRPFVEGGRPGVFQNRVADINGKLANAERDAAAQGVRAADAASAQERAAAYEAANKTNPGFRRGGIVNNERTDTEVMPKEASDEVRRVARLAWQNSPAGKEAMRRQIESVNQNTLARGSKPGQMGQSLDEMFQYANSARNADASNRLRDIATGRNFLEQKVMPVAGAVFGGAGGGSMGALGALSGVALGGSAASKAPLVADALGEIGQGLATSGKDAIRQSALKMATDPFKLQRLADLPGVVGNGARWALQVAQDPAAFAARSYTLSLQPEFRKALSGSDDGAGGQATP